MGKRAITATLPVPGDCAWSATMVGAGYMNGQVRAYWVRSDRHPGKMAEWTS